MENLKNTTGKAVKKENSTKRVLNQMEGITLVALVITIIVMLILAGVSISALMGNEGLFARTASAANAYKQASEKENTDIESLLNELDEALKGLEKTEPKPITELAKNGTLKVGDYINYDAGVWTQADLDKIDKTVDLHNTVSDEITGNQTQPDFDNQFGGFEIGDSRNSNSIPYNENFIPRTSGWRIWDIDDNGNVTIIHAGHSELYFYDDEERGSTSAMNMLRNRDCSMYENDYAKENSAHFLMGWEAAKWYTKNCGNGEIYELESEDEDLDEDGNEGENNFREELDKFVTAEEMPVIEVLENGSYFWLATSQTSDRLYYVWPSERMVNIGHVNAYGMRVLITLKDDFQLEKDTNKTQDGWNLWKIVKN